MTVSEARRDARETSPRVVPASPPATRSRAPGWRDPRLAVGVAVVAGCGLLGAVLAGGDEATSGVWATGESLREGEPLTTADLVRREVRFAAQADADRYLSADAGPPAGAVLAHDVGAGELLARTALTAAPSDAVAEVPLAVPAELVPASLTVGSVVDVWVLPEAGAAPVDAATGPRGPRATPARAALEEVGVLEVGRPDGAGSVTRQVVVAVDAGQEAGLSEALGEVSTGRVVLVRIR